MRFVIGYLLAMPNRMMQNINTGKVAINPKPQALLLLSYHTHSVVKFILNCCLCWMLSHLPVFDLMFEANLIRHLCTYTSQLIQNYLCVCFQRSMFLGSGFLLYNVHRNSVVGLNSCIYDLKFSVLIFGQKLLWRKFSNSDISVLSVAFDSHTYTPPVQKYFVNMKTQFSKSHSAVCN